MRIVCSLLLALWAYTASAEPVPQPEFFKPYAATQLRLPSVPLFTNDPYFSLWSPFDRLNGGSTRHWSDAEKAMEGLLRVDGKTYRFMGDENHRLFKEVVPMASAQEGWTARVSHQKQATDHWTAPSFDDAEWSVEQAAWGTVGEYPFCRNLWNQHQSDIYIRRTVELSAADLKKDLWLQFSHDDDFELFINGQRVVATGETWVMGEQHRLSKEEMRLLKPGRNLIAAHCHNNMGGAYADFGLFECVNTADPSVEKAEQQSVDVMATSTYYSFQCGPVRLDLVFTAPMLIDDLELLSTPVNYLSYQVTATDGKKHDVQFYFATTPQLTVNEMNQPTVAEQVVSGGMQYLKCGSVEQPVLKRKGDLISIDWGYLYLPAFSGKVALADAERVERIFAKKGRVDAMGNGPVKSQQALSTALVYVDDLGRTAEARRFMLLGYDEVRDIQYMGRDYKGYWARNGKTIFQAFEQMRAQYTEIMQRCRQLDSRIYDDALRAGNKQYAELLAGCYRHVMAAHKLFEDDRGNLLFFSKENNSNGCVNTVDLTYPEAPLFLCYNTDLQKAMMRSVFDYCKDTLRWGFADFAAHDLGTYPHANGQAYGITRPDADGGFGGNMPIEESGNLLILTAAVCRIEGNTKWLDESDISLLRRWTDYLIKNGQDPETQLCTDDFAGHWGHNANLALKAVFGVAAFGEILRLAGAPEAEWKPFRTKAAEMAAQWERDADDGDHYRLAFDRPGTWSIKYNLVWDKLWNLHLFSDKVMQKEISYYLTQQNEFGLPLDCRKAYSKSDWIMWAAAMAPDNDTFLQFADKVYHYADKTPTRWPISDWFWTDGEGTAVAFRARSVVAGHWMKVLADKLAHQ